MTESDTEYTNIGVSHSTETFTSFGVFSTVLTSAETTLSADLDDVGSYTVKYIMTDTSNDEIYQEMTVNLRVINDVCTPNINIDGINLNSEYTFPADGLPHRIKHLSSMRCGDCKTEVVLSWFNSFTETWETNLVSVFISDRGRTYANIDGYQNRWQVTNDGTMKLTAQSSSAKTLRIKARFQALNDAANIEGVSYTEREFTVNFEEVLDDSCLSTWTSPTADSYDDVAFVLDIATQTSITITWTADTNQRDCEYQSNVVVQTSDYTSDDRFSVVHNAETF